MIASRLLPKAEHDSTQIMETQIYIDPLFRLLLFHPTVMNPLRPSQINQIDSCFLLQTSILVFRPDSNHENTVGPGRLVITRGLAYDSICISIFIYFHGLLKRWGFVLRKILEFKIFSFAKGTHLWKVL